MSHGYWLRETDPSRQLAEVVRRFELSRSIAPFRRCVRCNDLLQPVAKEVIADRVPARARARYDAYQRCPSCARIYWAGSHRSRMEQLIAEILASAMRSPPGRA